MGIFKLKFLIWQRDHITGIISGYSQIKGAINVTIFLKLKKIFVFIFKKKILIDTKLWYL